MMDHRNLYGYGEHPPHAQWPDGARVAVSLVLNIEEGSERAISRGDDRNEPIYDMIQEPGTEPDLAMESHFDYGARAGYWRNRPGAAEVRRALLAQYLRRGAGAHAVDRRRRPRARLRVRLPRRPLDVAGRTVGARGGRDDRPRGRANPQGCRVRPVGWHSRSALYCEHPSPAGRGGGLHLRQRGIRRRSSLHRRGCRAPARRGALQPGYQRHALPAARLVVRASPGISPITSSTRSTGYGTRARRPPR